MDDRTRRVVTDPRNARARELLRVSMSRMQTPALKHEYLASVANAMRNPVAQEVDDDGATWSIGFGDFTRTLPLVLIIEKDKTIRHAFVPNLANPIEMRLTKELQKEEHQWCSERGVKPRRILDEIRDRGRSDINAHGLNRHPRGAFIQADIEDYRSGRWFATMLMPGHRELPAKPDMDNKYDRRQMEENLAASFNAQGLDKGPHGPSPKASRVRFDVEKKTKTLRFTDIEPDTSAEDGFSY